MPKPLNVETLLQALGDRTRLRLLNLIGDREVCVCIFVATLDEPQPKISRHLAYLRRVGLVAARREGKWMHYRVVPPPSPGLAQLFRQALDCFAQDATMRRDLRRFLKSCCGGDFVKIDSAVAPAPTPRETL